MPSRARSAVVIPDIGLPPNAPCQAPFFLLSPPALKQATNAFFLLGDSSSIGACRSPGARNDAEEEQIVSFREAGSSGLLLRLVMSAPLGMTKLFRRLPSDNSQAGTLGASCKNARSTEKEHHTQVINSSAQETLYSAHSAGVGGASAPFGRCRAVWRRQSRHPQCFSL